MDSAADFVEADVDSDDEAVQPAAEDTLIIHGVVVETREPTEKKMQKPKAVPRSAKRSPATRTSLQLLDICLPVEPPVSHESKGGVLDSSGNGLSRWLKAALLADSSTGADGNANESGSLTTRLSALTHRMRSLLRKSVYAKKSALKAQDGRWTDGCRPAGFMGAGLAEELCLAVFGRIQALRAATVGKQVCHGLLNRPILLAVKGNSSVVCRVCAPPVSL